MKTYITFILLLLSVESHCQEFNNYTEKTLDLNIEMIAVKGGSFIMGGSDDKESGELRHKVTLSDFYIGKFEVTQDQWEKIMKSNPALNNDCKDCPIINVSFADVQEFIKKLNMVTKKKYSLPTEAQWEFAARGGTQSNGFEYSGSNDPEQVAWTLDNSENRPHRVGRKFPNELGIFDMSGNVKEWCSDWYEDYTGKEEINPVGPANGDEHVLRGGGFGRYSQASEVTFRTGGDEASNFVGFRIALSK